MYKFLKIQGLDSVVDAFCDRMANKNGKVIDVSGKSVISYRNARLKCIPFVITVEYNTNYYKEIEAKLKEDGVEYYKSIIDYLVNVLGYDLVKINREYCKYHHAYNMDKYYETAESQDGINAFWGDKSIFYKYFKKLDLQNVIELGCGRGRHVPQYIKNAGNITLVDVLECNIKFVSSRFCNYNNIRYYQNNGHDLSELPDMTYTALFTYDAMVHFELLDIYEYLRETYRVLRAGGMALFHHSNDSRDYRNSFLHCTNHIGRN